MELPIQIRDNNREGLTIDDELHLENLKKIAENPDYVYLGADTLELNSDFSKNPARFFEKASLL